MPTENHETLFDRLETDQADVFEVVRSSVGGESREDATKRIFVFAARGPRRVGNPSQRAADLGRFEIGSAPPI